MNNFLFNTNDNKPRRFRRRGSTLLQMALVFPVLLYIIFGTFEFGEYFYVRHAYTGAAVAGAQTAIVNGQTYANVSANVATCLQGTLGRHYTLTVQDNGSTIASLASIQPGDNITVTISGTWSQIGSGFSAFGFLSGSKVVSGVSVMRAEMAP